MCGTCSDARNGAVNRTDLLASRGSWDSLRFQLRYKRDNLGETQYNGLNLALENGTAITSADACRIRSDERVGLSMDLNLDLNEGPSSSDRTHNFVLSFRGVVPKTGGLTLSGVYRALSGQPITIQDQNVDADRNGILFDPLPAGTYSGVGPAAITVDNEGGRNGARGPGVAQLDMRIGYRLRVRSTRTLDVFGEIFNVTNRVNFNNPTGDRHVEQFLVPTTLRGGGFPRQFQLGARFRF